MSDTNSCCDACYEQLIINLLLLKIQQRIGDECIYSYISEQLALLDPDIAEQLALLDLEVHKIIVPPYISRQNGTIGFIKDVKDQ